MGLLWRLFLSLMAAGALLTGIQLPGFVDQYPMRLDAHFLEVSANLRPFQEISDGLRGGRSKILIQKHERSTGPTCCAEGAAIRRMQVRFLRFENERIQLQASLPVQLLWIARQGDRELLDQTRRNYSFGILLDRGAVIAGFSFMIAVVVLLELLASLFRLREPTTTRARPR